MLPFLLLPLLPGQGEGVDYGDVGQSSAGGASSLWKVARNRGVLAGAFVTAYNYGVIGFLEVYSVYCSAIFLSMYTSIPLFSWRLRIPEPSEVWHPCLFVSRAFDFWLCSCVTFCVFS